MDRQTAMNTINKWTIKLNCEEVDGEKYVFTEFTMRMSVEQFLEPVNINGQANCHEHYNTNGQVITTVKMMMGKSMCLMSLQWECQKNKSLQSVNINGQANCHEHYNTNGYVSSI